MQYSTQNSIRPFLFKKLLGQYKPNFDNFRQHDSAESINAILDLLHEDLYRFGKKPYVENKDCADKTVEEASLMRWNEHLYRNESIISDLFHG